MTTQADYHELRTYGVSSPLLTGVSGAQKRTGWKLRTGLLVIGGILAVTDACAVSAIYLLAFFTGQSQVLVSMNAVGEFWYELPLVLLAVPMVLYLAVSGLILGLRARDAAVEKELNFELQSRISTTGSPPHETYGISHRSSTPHPSGGPLTATAHGRTGPAPRAIRQLTLTSDGTAAVPIGPPRAVGREPGATVATSELGAVDFGRGF